MDNLWNDLVYTDVMQSDGYVVDYAVLTTYSLDMPSLLSVPFMLGTMSDLTEASLRSPHLVLEAVNKSAGKFSVFCNAGCIAVPQANSKLYALLERSVVQIALPARGAGFVNFHPKVWVIKESNPDTEESQIKVVVLSRNLTCSNDLDVVCELVGNISTKQATRKSRTRHKPLADFLEWLAERSISKIRKQIRSIINDLYYVERFELKDSPFDDYDFFPMGIDGYDGMEQCLEADMLDHATEMVVISPFIDQRILEKMAACAPKTRKTLISRHASVTNDILSLFNDGVYAPKEVLTDKVEKDTVVDLHEKVYFIRRYEGNLTYNHLYLGSANATRNGFDRNVEFLLHLRFASYKTSYDTFRGDLIHEGKDCMFEQVTAVPADIKGQDNTLDELLLRQTIASIQKAEIKQSGECYTITVYCRKTRLPKENVKICPLGCQAMEKTLTEGTTFEKMELAMLTELYVLAIGDIRRVIKIDTTGMPTEERDCAIFRSIINTKGKFISYLAFMLTDDAERYVVESQQMEKELADTTASPKEQEISVSLYEDMVRVAYTNPDRIASIRSVIAKADASVIPDHFVEFYESFENAIKQIRRL